MGIIGVLLKEGKLGEQARNQPQQYSASNGALSHQRWRSMDAEFSNRSSGIQSNNSGAGNLIHSSGSGQSNYNFAPTIANASVVNFYMLSVDVQYQLAAQKVQVQDLEWQSAQQIVTQETTQLESQTSSMPPGNASAAEPRCRDKPTAGVSLKSHVKRIKAAQTGQLR